MIALLLLTAALPVAVAASAPKPAKADLKVTTGSVSPGNARVTGTFTVRNTGTRRAPATSTAIKVDGKRVRSVTTGPLKPGQQRTVRFGANAKAGRHVVSVCADRRRDVGERKEGNNCRALGTVEVAPSTVPTDPIAYTDNVVFQVGASPSEYWLNVPKAYDDTHETPIRLVVLLHGCAMLAQDTANQVKGQVTATSLDNFILMSPGLGRDGQCWDSTADRGPLVAAIADVKRHFNIDPRRVVLGGYSSGSTLAGQVALSDASSFAGLFVLPGRPFTSNENRTQLMTAAEWKLNIVWRAHKSDEFYPLDILRLDKVALLAAGWPLVFSEVAGTHAFDGDDLNYIFSRLVSWKTP